MPTNPQSATLEHSFKDPFYRPGLDPERKNAFDLKLIPVVDGIEQPVLTCNIADNGNSISMACRSAGFNHLLMRSFWEVSPRWEDPSPDKHDVILVLTDDSVELGDNCFQHLHQAMRDGGYAVAGPMAIMEDRESIEHGGGLEPYTVPVAKQGLASAGHHNAPGPDSFTTGAMIAIDRMALVRHGLLDESFLNHYLFTDYCFHVRQRGEKVGYAPAAKVYWPGEPLKTLLQQAKLPGIGDQYTFWRKWIGNRNVYTDMVSEVFP